MALVVPLSRFTSQVAGGSAFFVRHHAHASISYLTLELGCGLFCLERFDFAFRWRLGADFSILSAMAFQHRIGVTHQDVAGSTKRIRGCFDLRHLDCRRYSLVLVCQLFAFVVTHQRCPTASPWRFIVMPNKSPEPTAVGACSSAVAVHVASRRWLSFFR